MKTWTSIFLAGAAIAAWILFLPHIASAHCDTLDGPVVQDAKKALSAGDVTPVLKWVKAENEKEIREAFAKTLKVRGLGAEAREVADQLFFETLVRIHRAGEGVAFTGLKAAGTVDPGISAADKALKDGSAKELAQHLAQEVEEQISKRFTATAEKARHSGESVAAGRAYVAAYVEFIHYVEAVASLGAAEHQHLHAEEHAK